MQLTKKPHGGKGKKDKSYKPACHADGGAGGNFDTSLSFSTSIRISDFELVFLYLVSSSSMIRNEIYEKS
jgi:hypothetical protein